MEAASRAVALDARLLDALRPGQIDEHELAPRLLPDRRFVDVSTIDTSRCDRGAWPVCATARCSRPLSRSATSSSSDVA